MASLATYSRGEAQDYAEAGAILWTENRDAGLLNPPYPSRCSSPERHGHRCHCRVKLPYETVDDPIVWCTLRLTVTATSTPSGVSDHQQPSLPGARRSERALIVMT